MPCNRSGCVNSFDNNVCTFMHRYESWTSADGVYLRECTDAICMEGVHSSLFLSHAKHRTLDWTKINAGK